MASNLSFAPIAIFDSNVVDYKESALGLARLLDEKEIPSMLITRKPTDDLDKASRIAKVVLKRGILPVIEFYPTDKSSQLRNLHESAVLGTIDLVWKDGDPDFEIAHLLEFLLETWKTRIPLDFNIYFRGELPSGKHFTSTAGMISSVMKRNEHVQLVKLCEIPDGLDEVNGVQEILALWKMLLESCPDSEPALSPSLWVNYTVLRTGTYDLGLNSFVCEEPCDGSYITNEIKSVEYIAKNSGLPLVPRLPLTINFYKRSWFAINVGKVLSKWAERKAFKPYMERPRPQA